MTVLMSALALAVVAGPVRDPFWPIGYEGERHAITVEPRPKPVPKQPDEEEQKEGAEAGTNDVLAVAAAVAAAEVVAPPEPPKPKPPTKEEMEKLWQSAKAKLRFGGLVRLHEAGKRSGRATVMVNDRVCGAGDRVSVESDGWRFVWRIAAGGDSERELCLDRVSAVRVESSKNVQGQTKKGEMR